MLNIYPKKYLLKLVFFSILFIALLLAFYFNFQTLFSLNRISNLGNSVTEEEIPFQTDLVEELESLSFSDPSKVSKSILTLLDQNIEVIEYKAPIVEVMEFTTVYQHKFILRGRYEAIAKKVFELETKYPHVFLVSLKIANSDDFTKLNGGYNAEKTNNKVVAIIQLIHYSI